MRTSDTPVSLVSRSGWSCSSRHLIWSAHSNGGSPSNYTASRLQERSPKMLRTHWEDHRQRLLPYGLLAFTQLQNKEDRRRWHKPACCGRSFAVIRQAVTALFTGYRTLCMLFYQQQIYNYRNLRGCLSEYRNRHPTG
jgi:hypothetical protein